MNILIDGRMLGWTGIGRYTDRLLQYLPELDKVNHYTVLLLHKDAKKWQPAADNFTVAYTDIEPYSAGEQLTLPAVIRGFKPDLVHFPHFTVPLLYRGKFIVTIHDLTLLRYKNVRGTGVKLAVYAVKDLVMRVVIRSAVKRAARILTDTEFVKDDVTERYGVPASRIAVIPLATEPVIATPEPITKFVKDKNYLLYVGNSYPYKNLTRLADALKLLLPANPGLKLVLAGKPDYFLDALKNHVHEQGLEKSVVFTGFVTNGELVSLYMDAKLYVFPSLSEGFGLPGLEAMAQGTPVVAARASCLPEVYSDAAAYFDPCDVRDMAIQMDVLLGDAKRLESLRTAGQARVKKFSWHKMANETFEAYKI